MPTRFQTLVWIRNLYNDSIHISPQDVSEIRTAQSNSVNDHVLMWNRVKSFTSLIEYLIS